MLLGYNTNVSYKGNIYHIQTEDNGLKNPVIITLLYLKGSIIASQKTSYAHLVEDPNYKEKVRRLMKEQHRNMIKGLLSGEYTGDYKSDETKEESVDQPVEDLGGRRQITKSLDDILLDYIIRREK
jgi:hypothetical protein